VRAFIVIAGVFVAIGVAIAGVAVAAAPQPTTIERTPAPVEALAQDGGMLAWLAGDGKKCNTIHMTGNGNTFVLPQPPNDGKTCTWDLSGGAEQLAIAAGSSAALWTLHARGSDFVMTAQVGGKEIEVDRLAHERDGTGWWLGGTTGGGTTLAYSSIDVEYIDPLACGSGGSCKKKIMDGGVDLVSDGQTDSLPGAGPALSLSVSGGRIAYIPATTVAKGAPAAGPSINIPVEDTSSGNIVSQPKAVGVPYALGLSPHLLAVLSRGAHGLRLTWYDPATGKRLGGVGVPAETAPVLGVSDQAIVYRFGRALRAVVPTTRHVRALGKTAAQYLGLSLEDGRLVWAENHLASGRIRALQVP
jgi:hypothetical protein